MPRFSTKAQELLSALLIARLIKAVQMTNIYFASAKSILDSCWPACLILILVAYALDFDLRNSLNMGVMFFDKRAFAAQIGITFFSLLANP